MKDAVIVSTARTGLAKSVRGGFNHTHGAVMGGHTVKHAIARAGIEGAERAVAGVASALSDPVTAVPARGAP